MVEAVRQAKAKLQPARMGFGAGFSYLNVNRDMIDLQSHLWRPLANGRANSSYTPNDTASGAYAFQVLGSRLKPGYADGAIVNGLLDLIQETKR